MYTTREGNRRRRDRAASEIVGLILLFGIVIAGAGLIFWTGMDARDSVQSASEIDTAETSLEEASSKLSTLSFRGEGATTSFDLSGQDANDVTIEKQGTISFQLNGKSACRADLDLGSIVYENDDGTTVAYQAGGVFKKASGGVSIVQSPDLSYEVKRIDGRDVNTISFPVVNVSGEVSSSGTVTARANRSSSTGLNEELCLRGPNTDEIEYVREIKVTVEGSEYYEGWERFFRQEFGDKGTITVDDGAQKVSVVAPLGSGVHPSQFDVDNEQIMGAIFSGSSSGELKIHTTHAAVDSYDSSDGPWGGEPTYGENGTIVTRGDVNFQANGAQIRGNVFAEGEIDLDCGGAGSTCIDGDAYVNNSTGGGFNGDPSDRVSGDVGNGTVVPDLPVMDGEIESNAKTISENNHNSEITAVDERELEFSGGSAELTSGVYYLDEFTVPSGNTLELNTSGGDIVIAVEGDVEIDGTVNVSGDRQVRTFINDSTASGKQVTVGGGATVKVSEGSTRSYNSEQFFLVCKAGCSATFDDTTPSDPTEFTGVIYGPGEESDHGTVSLGKRVEVWGALVGGTVTFEQQSKFHFDTSLKTDEFSSYGSTPGDSDDDGIPDDEDDCPNHAGTGENGCAGVTKDESENVLVVNQSSATITVLGSQIADEQIVNATTETRSPVNADLVIDDSGSMNLYENYGWEDPDGYDTYTHESGPHETSSNWSSWERVTDASYVSSGEHTVPPGEQWEVYYYSPYQGEYVYYVLDSGENFDFESWDYVRRLETPGDSVTVPEGTVYVGDDDRNSDPTDSNSEVYYPGETISSNDHPFYHVITIHGNDVFFERLDAAETFVGSMASKDRVGLVKFNYTETPMKSISSDFNGVNDSLVEANWDSDGGTNIAESLDESRMRLEASADQRDGMNTTKAIVLLTDGQHTTDVGDVDGDGVEESYGDEIRGVAEKAHDAGIRIYVISLGDDTNEALLEDIANTPDNPATDGNVYDVENADELAEAYQEVANDTKMDKVRAIQHKNTTTTVHMGGDPVTLGSNTNEPGVTYPTYTVDSNLGVGNKVHFSSKTLQCAEDDKFGSVTNPTTGTTFNETTCDGTSGTANETTHDDDSAHQLFVDGDGVPTVGDGAWYKTESFTDIVTDYNSSFIQSGTFNLPENDAIILVNISDGEADDTDFMVLYFDATNTAPPEYDDDSNEDDSEDEFEPSGDGTENGYVVDVSSGEVNVSTGDSIQHASMAWTETGPMTVEAVTPSTQPTWTAAARPQIASTPIAASPGA